MTFHYSATPHSELAPVRHWGSSLAVALAGHGAVLGVALAVALWRGAAPAAVPPPAGRTVMIELAPASAPAVPATPLPPGPLRAQAQAAAATPQAARAAQLPVPRAAQGDMAPAPPPARAAPDAPPNPSPAKPDPAAAPASRAAGSSQASAPPAVIAPAAARLAARQTQQGAGSAATASWQALVLGRLEQFKRYPQAAWRLHQQGIAVVRYGVDRSGRVRSVALARSSGSGLLDSEAVATVRRASPLPPPPASLPGDILDVTTPIEFFMK